MKSHGARGPSQQGGHGGILPKLGKQDGFQHTGAPWARHKHIRMPPSEPGVLDGEEHGAGFGEGVWDTEDQPTPEGQV